MIAALLVGWLLFPSDATPAATGSRRPRAPVKADTIHHIDHVILGIGNLDSGVVEFERRTGVRPVFGGDHPNAGTRNALVSLGKGHYLEILAPQSSIPAGVNLGPLPTFAKLTPHGWAVRSADLAISRRRLGDHGFTTTEPVPGSRRTPAGALLAWSTVRLVTPKIESGPFLIQWGAGTPHPSTTTPTGCKLKSLAASDAASKALRSLVRVLNIPLGVLKGSRARMAIVLKCPKGAVTFSSP